MLIFQATILTAAFVVDSEVVHAGLGDDDASLTHSVASLFGVVLDVSKWQVRAQDTCTAIRH